MKKQNETPKYATLMYGVLHELDISIAEYFYLDMVYHLSHDGWCYKSLDSIALDMKMNRMGVMKLRNRLIEKGLIKKSIKGHTKTTDIYNKVIRTPSMAYNKVSNPYNKVISSVSQSYTKNNNRITKNNKGEFSKNKEKIRKALEQGKLSLLKEV